MYRAVIWTHVSSAGSDMALDNRHYVLQAPLIGIVPILVRYRVAFPTDFLPQLQLGHFTVHARPAVTSP